MKVGALAVELLDFFLPSICLGCRDHVSLERSVELVCQACRTRLRELPHPRCVRCGFPLGSKAERGSQCVECCRWDEALVGARSAFVLHPPANQRLVVALRSWMIDSNAAAPTQKKKLTAMVCPTMSRNAVVPPLY